MMYATSHWLNPGSVRHCQDAGSGPVSPRTHRQARTDSPGREVEIPNRPPADLATPLAAWLAGPRSRALRRAQIGLRRRVLEVGCGHGRVTTELRRRAAGPVIALDASPRPGVAQLAARAEALPFRDGCFDLVFFQNVLLWVPEVEVALREAARVLQPGGNVVAVEPDYGGMMEQPDLGLAGLWRAGLLRVGADPAIGRKLPGAYQAAGLHVWVELAHLPQPASEAALSLLEGLPLTDPERRQAARARQIVANSAGDWGVFLHVPYFLVVGTKSREGG